MRLRGHHLFCTALFSGHGYDEAFTRRVEDCIDELSAGCEITLTNGPDYLCAACPNLIDGGECSLGTDDVLTRDKNARRVLKLNASEKAVWPQVRKALTQISEDEFEEVCRGCRWQRAGLCSYKILEEKLNKIS